MSGSSMPGASGVCMNRLNSLRARYSLLRATTNTTEEPALPAKKFSRCAQPGIPGGHLDRG
jgi:hypothetical protein